MEHVSDGEAKNLSVYMSLYIHIYLTCSYLSIPLVQKNHAVYACNHLIYSQIETTVMILQQYLICHDVT